MSELASSVALDELKRYAIDPGLGFLPGEDPLLELPAEMAAWDEVAAELPRLLLTGRLRPVVESLPQLDPGRLQVESQRRRAMAVLSFLAHAYVWGESPTAHRLPAVLARPWVAVAAELGRPAVLSYASYALDNWRRYDLEGPVELGNIALLHNFLGGADEDWFIGIHIDIEAKAAPILREVGPVVDAAELGHVDRLTHGLSEIASALQRIVASLRRTPEHCDPYIYYQRVRPFIHGWLNQPALPQGLIYEGVEAFGGRPQKLRGETGAQSSIVPTLDALLQIDHAHDPLRTYLMEMRDYMPPGHRAFVAAIEGRSCVRDFVTRSAAPELTEIYDECLHWLEAFRSTHLEYAAVYIFRQAQSDPANPNIVGTGGTPFMPYLKKHRDETAAQRLNASDAPE